MNDRALHLFALVFALVAALVIKHVVGGGEQLSERVIEARVSYRQPAQSNLIVLDPVDAVRVRLRGRLSDMTQLNPFNVEAVVQLSDEQLGRQIFVLERDDVLTPGDFDIISIEPNRFELEVEPLQQIVVPIDVRLVGEPAAGALPGAVLVRPNQATLSGPASRVAELAVLPIEVSIDRRAISFEQQIPLVSPEPLVQVVDPTRAVVFVPLGQPEEPLVGPGGDGSDVAVDANAGADAADG
ncbi:MAG: CdaR family protein [Acidobacteriota bacterium]